MIAPSFQEPAWESPAGGSRVHRQTSPMIEEEKMNLWQ